MMMKNVCQSYFFPSENVSLLNWGEKDASNMCAIHSKFNSNRVVFKIGKWKSSMWAEIAVMKTESCFQWLKSFSHMCFLQHTSFIYSPPNASLSITTSCLERKQGIMCQCLSDIVTYTVSELLLASVTCCQLLESGSWEVKNAESGIRPKMEEPESDLFESTWTVEQLDISTVTFVKWKCIW